MAKPLEQERLQPALLDRLADNERDKRMESRDQRVLSLHRLRECVIRDLSWLFNTANLATTEDFDNSPEAAGSVLNYGVPEFSGKAVSGMDPLAIEHEIRQAIINFEPRILPDTVVVNLVHRADQMNPNAMVFDISGQLWANPLPLQLFLKTEVDLESGTVNVVDQGERGND